MMISDHTIAAISTAVSDAGIGIIRVSGPDAVCIVDRIFADAQGHHRLAQAPTHRILHGYILRPGEPSAEVLDEVLVSVMRAPHSYTAEDVVEVNCHGGRFVLGRVLELILQSGARLAEPGEFTKRAFLNGRIDLSEAEAVMEVISAQSDFALQNGERQLSGALSDNVQEIREVLLHETARIEAALDDPDVYDLTDNAAALTSILTDVGSRLETLLSTAEEGRIRRDGIDTIILGAPNAGKSSLFNRLTDSERAIVTQIPGTTRDLIEEQVRLGELVLKLIDTAGLRYTTDPVERIGVERAVARARAAQLVIYVVDGERVIGMDGRVSSEGLSAVRSDINKIADVFLSGRKHLLLFNKTDLLPGGEASTKAGCDALTAMVQELSGEPAAQIHVLPVSMNTGEGLEALKETIAALFLQGELVPRGEYYLTNLRHVEAVREALSSVQLVLEAIRRGDSEELYCTDLMAAYHALGRILGAEPDEDLFDEIFSSFCMGK